MSPQGHSYVSEHEIIRVLCLCVGRDMEDRGSASRGCCHLAAEGHSPVVCCYTRGESMHCLEDAL